MMLCTNSAHLALGKFLLLALTVIIGCHGSRKISMRMRFGELKGKRYTVLEKNVDVYLGVPYAEPPVGGLRFAPPKPWQRNWDEARGARKFGSSCWQKVDSNLDHPGTSWWSVGENLSEDCLFLNIWAPSPFTNNTAVMVWIHGGSFNWGSASVKQYDGKMLSASQGVVVVTINYRLGPLGFLALKDSEIRGNFGLMDQAMALQWIQENIADFGGDPELVTIFGSSAGGASVGYHLLSNMTRNLFRRAIVESGSPTTPPLKPRDSESILAQVSADSLVRGVGCSGLRDIDNSSKLMECLREIPAYNISHDQFASLNIFVVIDGTLLTNSPEVQLETGDFKNTEILAGQCQNEGMIDMVRLVPGYSIDTESLLTYDEFEMGVRYITWATSSQTKGLAEMAIFQYTDWKDKTNPAKLRDAVNDVYGDYILKCPTIDIVNAYSKAGLDTYYYDLRRRSSGSPWPGWMGVVHGDEIQYIFGHPLNTEFGPYSDEDVDLSLQMMHYWANFAKYGNPNPLTSNIWPRYTKDERRYFVINGALEGAPNIEDYPRTPYCEFWNNLVPQLEMGPQHYIPLMTVNKTQATTAVPTDEREVESKTSPTIATRAAPVRCQVSSSSASMSARYLTNRRVVASFAVGALLLHYLLVFWD